MAYELPNERRDVWAANAGDTAEREQQKFTEKLATGMEFEGLAFRQNEKRKMHAEMDDPNTDLYKQIAAWEAEGRLPDEIKTNLKKELQRREEEFALIPYKINKKVQAMQFMDDPKNEMYQQIKAMEAARKSPEEIKGWLRSWVDSEARREYYVKTGALKATSVDAIKEGAFATPEALNMDYLQKQALKEGKVWKYTPAQQKLRVEKQGLITEDMVRDWVDYADQAAIMTPEKVKATFADSPALPAFLALHEKGDQFGSPRNENVLSRGLAYGSRAPQGFIQGMTSFLQEQQKNDPILAKDLKPLIPELPSVENRIGGHFTLADAISGWSGKVAGLDLTKLGPLLKSRPDLIEKALEAGMTGYKANTGKTGTSGAGAAGLAAKTVQTYRDQVIAGLSQELGIPPKQVPEEAVRPRLKTAIKQDLFGDLINQPEEAELIADLFLDLYNVVPVGSVLSKAAKGTAATAKMGGKLAFMTAEALGTAPEYMRATEAISRGISKTVEPIAKTLFHRWDLMKLKNTASNLTKEDADKLALELLGAEFDSLGYRTAISEISADLRKKDSIFGKLRNLPPNVTERLRDALENPRGRAFLSTKRGLNGVSEQEAFDELSSILGKVSDLRQEYSKVSRSVGTVNIPGQEPISNAILEPAWKKGWGAPQIVREGLQKAHFEELSMAGLSPSAALKGLQEGSAAAKNLSEETQLALKSLKPKQVAKQDALAAKAAPSAFAKPSTVVKTNLQRKADEGYDPNIFNQIHADLLDKLQKNPAKVELSGIVDVLGKRGFMVHAPTAEAAKKMADAVTQKSGLRMVALSPEASTEAIKYTNQFAKDVGKNVAYVPEFIAGRMSNLAIPEKVKGHAIGSLVSKLWAPINTVFSGSTTIAIAAFHALNATDAVQMSYVAHGLKAANPELQAGAAAASVFGAFIGKAENLKMPYQLSSGETKSLGELYEGAKKLGVVKQNAARHAAHLGGTTSRAMELSLRGGALVGESVEDYQHFVTYLGALKSTSRMAMLEAAKFSKELSGNFNMHSPLMKALGPYGAFLNWVEFAVPYAAKQAVRSPQRLGAFQDIENYYGKRNTKDVGKTILPEAMWDPLMFRGTQVAPKEYQGEPGDLGENDVVLQISSRPGQTLNDLIGDPVAFFKGRTNIGVLAILNILNGGVDFRTGERLPTAATYAKQLGFSPVARFTKVRRQTLEHYVNTGDYDRAVRFMLSLQVGNSQSFLTPLFDKYFDKKRPTPYKFGSNLMVGGPDIDQASRALEKQAEVQRAEQKARKSLTQGQKFEQE